MQSIPNFISFLLDIAKNLRNTHLTDSRWPNEYDRWCKFFGHVPILTLVCVNFFRSYSNRNSVILNLSCELASNIYSFFVILLLGTYSHKFNLKVLATFSVEFYGVTKALYWKTYFFLIWLLWSWLREYTVKTL